MSNNRFVRSAVAIAAWAAVAYLVVRSVALLVAPVVGPVWTALSNLVGASGSLVEAAVLLVSTGVLVAAAAWLLLSLAVCATDLLAGREGAGRQPGGALTRPRSVRVLMAVALGCAGAAHPAPAPAERGPELPAAVDGLVVPDRPYGGVRTHLVKRGESLWSITAEHLPVRASARAVSRAWPGLYGLNRHRVGPVPDLVHPRTRLRLPAAWLPGSVPTRGADR